MIDQDKMRAIAKGLRVFNARSTNEAADAIDLLLAELEAAAADKRDYLDTLVQVLNVIGYSEEFAAAYPDLKVSEGVKLFLAQRQGEGS